MGKFKFKKLKKKIKKAVKPIQKIYSKVGKAVGKLAPIAGAVVGGPAGAALGTVAGSAASGLATKGSLKKKFKAAKKTAKFGAVVTAGSGLLALAGGTGLAGSGISAVKNIFGGGSSPSGGSGEGGAAPGIVSDQDGQPEFQGPLMPGTMFDKEGNTVAIPSGGAIGGALDYLFGDGKGNEILSGVVGNLPGTSGAGGSTGSQDPRDEIDGSRPPQINNGLTDADGDGDIDEDDEAAAGGGSKMKMILVLGAVGVAAWFFLRKKK